MSNIKYTLLQYILFINRIIKIFHKVLQILVRIATKCKCVNLYVYMCMNVCMSYTRYGGFCMQYVLYVYICKCIIVIFNKWNLYGI